MGTLRSEPCIVAGAQLAVGSKGAHKGLQGAPRARPQGAKELILDPQSNGPHLKAETRKRKNPSVLENSFGGSLWGWRAGVSWREGCLEGPRARYRRRVGDTGVGPLSSPRAPRSEWLVLSLMLCRLRPQILNIFPTRGSALSLYTRPHKLCSGPPLQGHLTCPCIYPSW